jgi:hypothetical protein
MEVRRATDDDVDAAAETIAQAFVGDPVWGPALRALGADDLRRYWRTYVEGARRHDTVHVSEGAGTVSVWIPPGEAEMSPEQEGGLRELAEAALGPGSKELFELWGRFDASHPQPEPHAYLSLLATRPDLAGHGFGMAHLRADLARWDAAGLPSYLESTNPRNDARYGRQGYRPIGEFRSVLDGAVVTTMWRAVGGSAEDA